MSNLKLKTGLLLVKLSFDNLENHNPITETLVRVFVDGDNLLAMGKASEYIKSMEKEARYTGYDGRVYPIYELRRITVE
jgi:hypothetical protein